MILVFVNIVFAAPDFITHDSRPKIEATYNESVTLLNYSLKSLRTNAEEPLRLLSSTDRSFLFQPNFSLYNGYYDFSVNARDLIGNTEIYNQKIIINATQTEIFLEKPRTGYSTVETFDIIVGTTKPSDCKYSFIGVPSISFTSVDPTKTRHTLKDYNLADKNSRPFYVACTDNESLNYTKEFEIGVLKDAPQIKSAKAIPNPVVMRPPTTTLKVETTQETVCTADGKYFDGNVWNERDSYSTINTKFLTLPENKNKYSQNVNIRCENLAETAVTTQLTISVDMQAAFKIVSVDSPKKAVSNKDFVNLTITTNKRASCIYRMLGGQDRQMNSSDKIVHNAPLGQLNDPKNYTVALKCVDEEGKEDSMLYTFVVDATPPSTTDIKAWACKGTEAQAIFSAADNESGIEGYNYTLSSGAGTAVQLASGFTTSSNITIKNLNLSKDVTYTLSAMAKNNAGMFGSQTTKTFSLNPNATECLEKNPPITKLNKTVVREGIYVEIICIDESGCNVNNFKWATAGEKQNCTPVTPPAGVSKNSTTISSTMLFCWYVEDNVGNNASKQEFIQAGAFVTNCYNLLRDGDETDVDCGGSCPACQDNSKCVADKDCISKYCKNGICTAALCDDLIKNGYESDTDCGGKCEKCDIGKSCNADSDCKSNYCKEGVCTESSCTDGIKNGFETDVDCGGNCTKCEAGKACRDDSDCKSNACEFAMCKEEETWESFALKYGLDADDKDGDADNDGLSNYEEFLKKTDPTNKDTDGDGYTDGKEVKAGTNPLDAYDYPKVSALWRILLLVLGVLVLAMGLLLMYYFKADKQTSINLMILGGAAILFALLDFYLETPAFVPVLLSLALVGGAGYFIYTQYETIMKQFKPAPKAAPPTISQTAAQAPRQIEERKPIITPEQMLATRQMIEMIKRQKEERLAKRRKLFESFGEIKPKEKLEKIEKIEIKPIQKIVQKAKESEKPEDIFEKLGKLTKSDEFEKLSKLLEKKPDQAFDKLSEILKRKDVFEKLPKTDKEISSLLEGKPIEKLRKSVKKVKK